VTKTLTTRNAPEQGLANLSLKWMYQPGQAANPAARKVIFSEYRKRLSRHTCRRQDSDLNVFGDYLRSIGITPGDLVNDPQAWESVTWQLLEAFKRWMLQQGYAVSTVNIRLTTARVYAALAVNAGVLQESDLPSIRFVKGCAGSEAALIDEQRDEAGIATRRSLRRNGAVSNHKRAPIKIGCDQARLLKLQPDNPKGRRDTLLMCILLDHGLRAGEVSGLTVEGFDLEHETMSFYRPKVDKTQTHHLTAATLAAARAYFEQVGPIEGDLWRQSRKSKSGELVVEAPGMSPRAITKRVGALGEAIGLVSLSPHDCRHYWATQAARSGTPLDRLMQAGGWNSPEMPLRYIQKAEIANEGVKLE
jgi:integrase